MGNEMQIALCKLWEIYSSKTGRLIGYTDEIETAEMFFLAGYRISGYVK